MKYKLHFAAWKGHAKTVKLLKKMEQYNEREKEMETIKIEIRNLHLPTGRTQYVSTRLVFNTEMQIWEAEMISFGGSWTKIEHHQVKSMSEAKRDMAVKALELAIETNS